MLERKTQKFSNIVRLRNVTFQQILNDFFSDDELKGIIAAEWCGRTGLPPSMSLFINLAIDMIETLKYGSVYFKGENQSFANAFVKGLIKNGGNLVLGRKVEKILIERDKVCGIVLEDGTQLRSKYIVSNVDAKQTFFNLIGEEYLSEGFLKMLNNWKVSLSAFIVYLGVDIDLKNEEIKEGILWMSQYDIEKEYENMDNNFALDDLYISIPSNRDSQLAPLGKSCLKIEQLISYDYCNNWNECKEEMANKLIKAAEQIIPSLSNHIEVKEIATPLTLERYTLNSEGACFGWAKTIKQSGFYLLNQKIPIQNLYLAGHWTFPGHGIPTVAYSGIIAANEICSFVNF